jgi:inner membrane protein
MSSRTHIAVAAAAGIWTVGIVPSAWILSVMVGGLLPDIDEPESAIGRRCWWLAWPLKRLVGHRTLTHSLLGVLLLGAVTGLVIWHQGWSWYIPAGLMLGMLIHCVLDAISGSVMFWWPNKVKVSWARWSVFGWQDKVLGGLASLAVLIGMLMALQTQLGTFLSTVMLTP